MIFDEQPAAQVAPPAPPRSWVEGYSPEPKRPSIRPKKRKGRAAMDAISGTYQSTKTGACHTYRSRLEAHYMEYLDKNPNVVSWEYETVWVPLGGGRYYNPDFKVTYSDGSVRIVEIKAEHARRHKVVLAKKTAALDFCNNEGWGYELLTPKGMLALGINVGMYLEPSRKRKRQRRHKKV